MAIATIRDVAREASTSVASVSRVLNGTTSVSVSLRARVEAAAHALGYVPHAGARSLSLARTGAIGVVLPDVHGEFFSESMRGMDRAAWARGLQLLLANVHADPDRAVEALRTMRGRVDGLVIMAPDIDPALLAAHLPASVPTVLINCSDNDLARPELRVDNRYAAAAMVDHLVVGGRSRIVHVAGPAGNIEAAVRAEGYQQAMARHGLPSRIVAGDFSEDGGIAAAELLCRASERVDAIFAANDIMAIGVLMTLKRLGVAVPEAIAVAGFDDIPLARLVSPALTTMRVDIAGVGARAVARLADLIDGEGDTAIEVQTPELIIRDTTR